NNLFDVTRRRQLRRVVALGGGTGLPAVLTGLRRHLPRSCRITAVVTAADDGGSSGILRQQYNVLPPGDIRHCLIALARVAPGVLAALGAADMLILGPGSFYTSVLAAVIVPGIAEAILASEATKIFICNLMTEPGETDRFDVAAHLDALHAHGLPPETFDYV